MEGEGGYNPVIIGLTSDDICRWEASSGASGKNVSVGVVVLMNRLIFTSIRCANVLNLYVLEQINLFVYS